MPALQRALRQVRQHLAVTYCSTFCANRGAAAGNWGLLLTPAFCLALPLAADGVARDQRQSHPRALRLHLPHPGKEPMGLPTIFVVVMFI